MKRTLLALPLAALAIVGWPAVNAAAQETKTARGIVTAIGANSVTIRVREVNMTFAVDAKTMVEAVGAGTKTRQAESAGKAGPTLTEVVKTGQPVEVSYRLAGGKLHAARIKAVSSAGSGSVADAKPEAKTSTGTVKSLSGNALTISGSSGGGATFSQTFTVDGTTKVIGKGVGTAVAKKGGRDAIIDLVKTGDHVSVSYHETGKTLHAAEVRVTVRAGGTR
jgi:hypothetical protein